MRLASMQYTDNHSMSFPEKLSQRFTLVVVGDASTGAGAHHNVIVDLDGPLFRDLTLIIGKLGVVGRFRRGKPRHSDDQLGTYGAGL